VAQASLVLRFSRLKRGNRNEATMDRIIAVVALVILTWIIVGLVICDVLAMGSSYYGMFCAEAPAGKVGRLSRATASDFASVRDARAAVRYYFKIGWREAYKDGWRVVGV
jgi:hypothetical protein